MQFGAVLVAGVVVVCLRSLLNLRTLRFEFKVAGKFWVGVEIDRLYVNCQVPDSTLML